MQGHEKRGLGENASSPSLASLESITGPSEQGDHRHPRSSVGWVTLGERDWPRGGGAERREGKGHTWRQFLPAGPERFPQANPLFLTAASLGVCWKESGLIKELNRHGARQRPSGFLARAALESPRQTDNPLPSRASSSHHTKALRSDFALPSLHPQVRTAHPNPSPLLTPRR